MHDLVIGMFINRYEFGLPIYNQTDLRHYRSTLIRRGVSFGLCCKNSGGGKVESLPIFPALHVQVTQVASLSAQIILRCVC